MLDVRSSAEETSLSRCIPPARRDNDLPACREMSPAKKPVWFLVAEAATADLVHFDYTRLDTATMRIPLSATSSAFSDLRGFTLSRRVAGRNISAERQR